MLPLSHVGFTTAAAKIAETIFRIKQMDYRVLVLASLLPDLIDKPLANVLEGSYIYESRAFGHSLIFLLCVFLLTLVQMLWSRCNWIFPAFLGILLHDFLDAMWLHPGIFFWPLEGWQFPKPVDEAWHGKISFGSYSISELDFYDNISVLILLVFFMKMALNGKIGEFFHRGRL